MAALSQISIVVLLAIGTFLFWGRFWKKHAKPASRLSLALGGFLLLALSIFPLLLILQALHFAEIPCLGPYCSITAFYAESSPVGFWLEFSIVCLLGMVFLSGAIFAVTGVLARDSVAP